AGRRARAPAAPGPPPGPSSARRWWRRRHAASSARLTHGGLGMTHRPASRTWLYRHTAATRLSHWITVLCLLVLVPSGLQIFNAHPTLYWGERSDPEHTVFALRAIETG